MLFVGVLTVWGNAVGRVSPLEVDIQPTNPVSSATFLPCETTFQLTGCCKNDNTKGLKISSIYRCEFKLPLTMYSWVLRLTLIPAQTITDPPPKRSCSLMLTSAKRSPYIVNGNLNSQRYIDEILRPLVLSFLQQIGPNAVFQDDNARPHRGRIVNDFWKKRCRWHRVSRLYVHLERRYTPDSVSSYCQHTDE
jgi:hypothetical protein